MSVPRWQLGALVIALVCNCLVVYGVVRLARRTPAADDQTAPAADDEADVLTCSDCGAENEPGYRYCRACVAALPRAIEVATDQGEARGRLTR